ncbi:hypothetical protein ABPG75_004703 [Micractinium tetrahymenae]
MMKTPPKRPAMAAARSGDCDELAAKLFKNKDGRRRLRIVLLLAGTVVACAFFRAHDPTGFLLTGAPSSTDKDLSAALSRRTCPAYAPGDQPSIAFLHIPKTAGTLLMETLKSVMPKEGPGRWCRRGNGPLDDLPHVFSTCSAGAPDEDHQRLFATSRRNFLAQCSGFAAHQDWAFFEAVGVDPEQTISLVALRHPVDRVISDYFYSLKQNASWLNPYKPANSSDFSGLRRFVEDNRDKLNNINTQMLGGSKHCAWPGTPPNTPPHKVLTVAKHNLEKTCVILLTEYLEESLMRLSRVAGWREDTLLVAAKKLEEQSKAEAGQRVNATPKPQVPLEIRQLIAQYNHLDMQLYEHAVRLFLHQR